MKTTTKVCKHGTFTFLPNDKFIGGSLEQTGTYSEEEVQKLFSLLGPNDVVVEVGANIGAITIPLAKRVKEVHAFEPQWEIFTLLEANIAQNEIEEKTFLRHSGIGGKRTPMGVPPIDYDKPGVNTGGISMVPPERTDIVTMLDILDDYCQNFDRVDLIKIDVEGMEGDVIDGGVETIKRFRPLLYVENDRSEKSPALIAQIMALDYRLYWHLPELFNPDPMSSVKMVSINMLCVPRERSTALHTLPMTADEDLATLYYADLTPIKSPQDDWRLAYERSIKANAFTRYAAASGDKFFEPPIRTALDNPVIFMGQTPSPRRPFQSTSTWACIARLGGVGDNIIASSVLPALREKYGHVEVIASKPQHVVFENNPHVDRLTVFEPGFPPWGDGNSWQGFWADRAREYAFFANLSHTVETLRALSPVQTAYHWPAAARRKLCGHSYLETAADICGVSYETLAPNFFPDDLEVECALETKKKIGGRYLGWVLSGTRIDKIWPATSLAVARIIKEFNFPVVLFGMPGKDFQIAKEIQAHVKAANGSDDGVHLACSVDPDRPNWPIRRLLTQVQQSDIVVSVDTGPAWAVAMRSMHKVILLSHASPQNITARWVNTTTLHADQARVPCWPCHMLIDTREQCERLSGRKGEIGAACISDITVDQVVYAVRDGSGTKEVNHVAK